jgi:cobalamin biosynthesis Mg chelatase CobN
MQQHGYKGGFEMAASLDYLFAYDASTGRVPDWGYGAIQTAWLDDPTVRGVPEQQQSLGSARHGRATAGGPQSRACGREPAQTS